MGALLDQMLAPATLDAAWRRLRGDHAVWAPGLSRAQMEPHFVEHLLRLRDEVRAGRYQPAPLRHFPVLKADGKLRVLSALTLRDKLLQRAALCVLEPKVEALLHPDSFAYRPGRNVEQAHGRACERIRCGFDWLVDADIRGFFDNIPQAPLRKRLQQLIGDRELLRLCDQWLAQGDSRASLFSARRGISQGAILSPLFCNLYLDALDRGLHAAHLPFVRYADDFLVFTPDQPSAQRAHALTARLLRRLGLELHPNKSRVTRAGPHVVFLGKSLPAYRPPAKATAAKAHKGATRRK